MIILDDLAYVHFPKAAGSTIRVILRDLLGGDNRKDLAHLPAYEVREYWGEKFLLGSVRNPLSWYEARVNYSNKTNRPLPFNGYSVAGMSADIFISNMANDDYLFEHKEVEWLRGDKIYHPFKTMLNKRFGFFTFEFLLTYSSDPEAFFCSNEELCYEALDLLLPDFFIHAETMEDDLIAVLEKICKHRMDQIDFEKVIEKIKSHRRVNVRKLGDREILTPESEALVMEMDGLLMQKFY